MQTPCYRERLSRIDKECAGKQRNQCQHGEIDTVGAGERIALLSIVVFVPDNRSRRDHGAEPFADVVCLNFRFQFQIDAVNFAKPSKQPLCRSDIGHTHASALGYAGEETAHDHRLRPAIGIDRYSVTDAEFRCDQRSLGKKQRVAGKYVVAVSSNSARWCADQAGRDHGCTNDIEPKQSEGLTVCAHCLK